MSYPVMIAYATLDLADIEEDVVSSAFAELVEFVHKMPLSVAIDVRKISEDQLPGICEAVSGAQNYSRLEISLMDLIDRGQPGDSSMRTRVLICSPPDGRIATLAKELNPDAEWGMSGSVLASVYGKVDRYVIWHEALHLLGADDCYQLPDKGPCCELPNCIMQYEPTLSRVGRWPFICSKNIQSIQTHCSL